MTITMSGDCEDSEVFRYKTATTIINQLTEGGVCTESVSDEPFGMCDVENYHVICDSGEDENNRERRATQEFSVIAEATSR